MRGEASRMNEEKREENIQSSKDEVFLPKLDKKDLILSLAVVLLCGCILSGFIPSSFVGFAGIILFAYALIAIKNVAAIIQIFLAAIIVSTLTFLPIAGVAVLALVLGTGTLSWLFMTLPKYKWAPVCLLLVAYGLGFVITSNPITPLLALAFLPAAALMAWAHARDIGRTATVLHALLGFIVAVLATLCIALWQAYGSVNYNTLIRFIDDLKNAVVSTGLWAGEQVWQYLESTSKQSAVSQESLEQFRATFEKVFNESSLRATADMIVSLIPAIIIAPALILSYLSNMVLLRKYYNTEWRLRMTPAACSLTIGPAAGLVYFISFVIVMFVSKQSLFLMATYNMFIILLPGMCLTGINAFLQNARRAKGPRGMISILFLVAAICCIGLSSFCFIALFGAYVTITVALHQKILQKMKDNNGK